MSLSISFVLLFDDFAYLPSIGASGGIITIWTSPFFDRQLVFRNDYAITVVFISKHNSVDWILTNIYGPCNFDGKRDFVHWFKNIQMPSEVD